jgi:hypothetical protein
MSAHGNTLRGSLWCMIVLYRTAHDRAGGRGRPGRSSASLGHGVDFRLHTGPFWSSRRYRHFGWKVRVRQHLSRHWRRALNAKTGARTPVCARSQSHRPVRGDRDPYEVRGKDYRGGGRNRTRGASPCSPGLSSASTRRTTTLERAPVSAAGIRTQPTRHTATTARLQARLAVRVVRFDPKFLPRRPCEPTQRRAALHHKCSAARVASSAAGPTTPRRSLCAPEPL